MRKIIIILLTVVVVLSGCSVLKDENGFPITTSKNTMFRGQLLGSELTDKQVKAISNGSFDNMWLGDYWVINDVVYRIWGFDWYLGKGDCTQHHLVILPDSNLIHADGSMLTYMNSISSTVGGYAGAELRQNLLPQCLETIIAAFGDAHILNHSELICNAVDQNTGKPGGWNWYDTKIEIPSEMMMYGSTAWGDSGFNVGSLHPVLPLAMVRPEYVVNGENYWLRDIVSATSFANIEYNGAAHLNDATATWIGIRPFFLLG